MMRRGKNNRSMIVGGVVISHSLYIRRKL